MSEDPQEQTTTTSIYPPMSCECLVYRLATSKSWVNKDTGQLQPAAYVLKPANDRYPSEKGFSVGIASCYTPEQYCSKEVCRLTAYAVATHHVGHIRSIGLEPIQDAVDHAEVMGMFGLDEADVINLREKLSEQSRVQYPDHWKWKRPTKES